MVNETAENEAIKPYVTQLFSHRMQIGDLYVMGYSGDSDQHCQTLQTSQSNEHRLFWLGYEADIPEPAKNLFAPHRKATFIGGCDFDRTMIALAEALDVWPPQFVQQPLHHVGKIFSALQPYPIVEAPDGQVHEKANADLKAFFDAKQAEAGSVFGRAFQNILDGEAPDFDPDNPSETSSSPKAQDRSDKDLQAWKLFGEALDAQNKNNFDEAGKKYAAALDIKPYMHQALNNWGLALAGQQKYAQAEEKYAAALDIKPDLHEALNNWGVALADQQKYAQAKEKFAAALDIKPDKHEALFNWACLYALKRQPDLALEKLKAAHAVHPLTQAKLDQDSDFDLIREDADFKAFRSELGTWN